MSRYKVFLLYVLILLPCLAMAEVRTIEKARELAYDFMASKMPQTKSSSMNLRMVYSGEDVLTKSSLEPAYYVFNNESGPGFVVISGEDSTLPVLGFSDKYNFKKEGMPANLSWWFRYMSAQVSAARDAALPVFDRNADVGSDVVKYETALWDQGEPYNAQCPMDGRYRSVTGCGPTAIAIAMRWHQWPVAGKGVIPAYQVEEYDDYGDVIGYSDFPGRTLGETYDWSNMPLIDGYYGSWTYEQEDQVARLMADIGAATLAYYSAEGTGILDEDVPPAMKTYFGYGQSMDVVFRQDWYTGEDDYTASEWYRMVKSELAKGPAIYAGADYEGTMGHMFILAGYTTKDYYYLNWGWGGLANGYYTLEALTPEEQGYGANELGSYHDWVSLMVNMEKDPNFDAGPGDGGSEPEPEPEPEPVYNLKENASLVYDHAGRKLIITVESGAGVSARGERGESVPVIPAGSDVYEIDARGLSGVYEVILSKGSSQEVVQIILGE